MNNQKHRGYIYGSLNRSQQIVKERRIVSSTLVGNAITAVKTVARKVKEFFTGAKEMFVNCCQCRHQGTLYKFKGRYYHADCGTRKHGQKFISAFRNMTRRQRRSLGLA